MEIRAQRVLSSKKNSCINKNYLWKDWTTFWEKLYLSSLSWKGKKLPSLTDMAESSLWWAITYRHGSRLPTFSIYLLPDLLGGGLWRTPSESRTACVKARQAPNFGVEDQWGNQKVQFPFLAQAGRRTLRIKRCSECEVAFSFLPNDAQGDSKQLFNSSEGPLIRALPAPTRGASVLPAGGK